MSAPATWELHARPCPLCGEETGGRVFAEARIDEAKLDAFAFASRKVPELMHHRLVACPRCDVLYASPVPSASLLARAYHEAAFDSGDAARHASETYAHWLDRVARDLPDRRGALDVGTGDGAFLERLLDRGFSEVQGVEPSHAPIESAASRVRSLIREGTFRASDFAPASLALVTCFQTLEHLPDPLVFAREAHALTKPGGALLVVGHDRRAPSARVLGRRSPIFDLEHLQLFSRESLRALLARAGYERVQVHSLVNRYPLRYWARLFPLPRGLKTRLLAGLATGSLGGLMLPMAAGNLVAWGFKPRG